MKSKILLRIVLILFCTAKIASAQLTFQISYAGGGYTQGHSVHQTTDGGYIVVGYAENLGAGIRDVYLIKTSITGDTLWTKTYGGTGYDEGFCVEQTKDGGYIITGHSTSFGTGAYEVYLIKTDEFGNKLWSKTYGGKLAGTGYSVHQATDGGYIITGAKVSPIGIHDVLLIKTDAIGDTLWTKTWGGTGDDYGYSVKQAIDGGYIVAGNHSSGGVYLIKTDGDGNQIWTQGYKIEGPPHINTGYSIQQTADTGYIIAGVASGASGMEAFLLKTNSLGSSSQKWCKTYSGANHVYINSVQQTSDDGYILSGWTQAFPVGVYKSLLIRTDALGDTLWTRTYRGGSSVSSVEQTTDGGFILLASDNFNIYLIKTDVNGNSSCDQGNAWPSIKTNTTIASIPVSSISSGGTSNVAATIVKSGGNVTTLCANVGINEIPKSNSLFIYPNPFTNEIIVNATKKNGVVLMFDITGKEILRQKTFNHETIINTKNLLPGSYLLTYYYANENATIKLIKTQ